MVITFSSSINHWFPLLICQDLLHLYLGFPRFGILIFMLAFGIWDENLMRMDENKLLWCSSG